MDLEGRVQRLERENRRWKLAGMLAVGLGLVTMALTGAEIAASQERPDVVEARAVRADEIEVNRLVVSAPTSLGEGAKQGSPPYLMISVRPVRFAADGSRLVAPTVETADHSPTIVLGGLRMSDGALRADLVEANNVVAENVGAKVFINRSSGGDGRGGNDGP